MCHAQFLWQGQVISSVVWATEATYDHEAYSQIRNRSSSNAEDVDFLDDVFDAGMSMPSVPVGISGQAALAADGSDNVVTPMAPRLRPCSPPSTTVLLPPLEPEGSPATVPSSKATKAASNPTSCQSRRHHGDHTSGSSGDPTSSSSEGTNARHHSRASGCEDSSALTKTPSLPAAVDAEQSGVMRAGTNAVTNNTSSAPWGATFGFRVDSATSAAAYASKVSLPPGRDKLPPQSPWFLVDGLPSFGLAQQSELKKRPAPQELENTSAALLKKLRSVLAFCHEGPPLSASSGIRLLTAGVLTNVNMVPISLLLNPGLSRKHLGHSSGNYCLSSLEIRSRKHTGDTL